MDLFEKLENGSTKLAVIGLGYVGLPIAVAFAKKYEVIGYDSNAEKVNIYKSGVDVTSEVGDEAVQNTNLNFTSDSTCLKDAQFYVVAVPTPVNADHMPDLSAIKGASRILGKFLTKDSIVVYESTVYPGVTEEVCLPILEEESGLKCGQDFKIGYSPERINPGDKTHRLENIVKIVSGMDKDTLDMIYNIYSKIIAAGVYRAPSIKVAEAAKVIENSQRDINIAFMNELSVIFHKMDIDTKEVLEAAETKWNFLKFRPGLVGGHCIGVDPYYLTYKAGNLGYRSQIILSGRNINDGMGKYIAECIVKKIVQHGLMTGKIRTAILGITFKENCKDIRNTKVVDVYNELKEYGIEPLVVDPMAESKEVFNSYSIKLSSVSDLKDMDVVIVAVGHDIFKKLSLEQISGFYSEQNKKVMFDIKGIYDKHKFLDSGFVYWRL